MSDPPTGTITFLFTDIEGSTRLWERNPEAMQGALSRHDEILRDAIEAHHGYVFKTVGDAFCAAFHTATEALEAALEAQYALFAEEWTEDFAIKVRMALHTGTVEERNGDYVGPPVNRVATLCEEGLALGRELGDKALTAGALLNLGQAMLEQGDPERATVSLKECLALFQDLGDKNHLYSNLLVLAGAAGAEAKPRRAARLFGAIHSLRESTDISLLDFENRALYERFLAEARSQIEEKTWERAGEEGRAMALEEAVRYALGEEDGGARRGRVASR